MFELQNERLAAEQRKQEAQAAALKAGQSVVEDLKHLTTDVMAKDAATSAAAQKECELQYLYVAARHLWFQRSQMQLWLQRAEYFVNELKSKSCFFFLIFLRCVCMCATVVLDFKCWNTTDRPKVTQCNMRYRSKL